MGWSEGEMARCRVRPGEIIVEVRVYEMKDIGYALALAKLYAHEARRIDSLLPKMLKELDRVFPAPTQPPSADERG